MENLVLWFILVAALIYLARKAALGSRSFAGKGGGCKSCGCEKNGNDNSAKN